MSHTQQLLEPVERPPDIFCCPAKKTAVRGRGGGVLELESYSKTGPERIAHVGYEEAAVVATVRDVHESDRLMDKLTDLLERIERLEADSQSAGTESRSGHRRSNERSAGTGLGSGHRRLQQSALVCRKCGQEGHYTRGCAQRQ